MDDAGFWRHDAKVTKRVLTPLEELIAFPVALEFQNAIERECVPSSKVVDLYGVVDDQVRRLQRINRPRVAAHLQHRFPHGGKIHNGRDSGKVLHQDPSWPVGDLDAGDSLWIPCQECLDVAVGDAAAVFVTQ